MYGERRPEFDPDRLVRNMRSGWSGIRSRLPGGGGNTAIFAGVALVIAVIWVGSGVYQVEPNEQAATQLFGEFQTIEDPGLKWWWPAPVGRVQKESVTETKTMTVGFRNDPERDVPVESLMITGDLNIADVKLAVQYRIGDLAAFLFRVDDPGDPDGDIRPGRPDGRTLRDVTEASLRQVIGQRSIDDVLTRAKEEVQFDTAALLQTLMDDYETGINILSVQLQEVTPPDPVRAAFDEVVAARSDKETRVNQAAAVEQDQIPRALGAAQQTIQAATAFKQARIERASGEADQFLSILAEYRVAPDVTRQRLFLEAIEDILPSVSIFIIDEEAGSGVLPFLPLTGGTPNVPGVTGGGQ